MNRRFYAVGLGSCALLALCALVPMLSVASPLGAPPPAEVSRATCTAWVGCAATDTFPGRPTVAGFAALAGAVLCCALMVWTQATMRRWPRVADLLTRVQFAAAIVTGAWIVVAVVPELLDGGRDIAYREWNYTVLVRPRWTILLLVVALVGIVVVTLRCLADLERRPKP